MHTTKRRTQPWKAGPPADYTLREPRLFDFFRGFGGQRYGRHPDHRQEASFYLLLAEMVDSREVSRQEIILEMAANHVRHDSLELIDRHRGWALGDATI